MTAKLAAALRAAAHGILPDEAAAGLLIDSGCFLHRPDVTRFTRTAAGAGNPAALLAWTDWDAVTTALDHGRLHASSGEKAVLRLAASLATGNPVSLRDTVPGLDHRNLNLLTTAIRHAAGHR